MRIDKTFSGWENLGWIYYDYKFLMTGSDRSDFVMASGGQVKLDGRGGTDTSLMHPSSPYGLAVTVTGVSEGTAPNYNLWNASYGYAYVGDFFSSNTPVLFVDIDLVNFERLFLSSARDTFVDQIGTDNEIYSQGGNDHLNGGTGDDALHGGAGRDLVKGGAGHDTLTGGSGADHFVIGDGTGFDEIMDFDSAQLGEVIDLRALTEITDFEDLQAHHLGQFGANIHIFADSWATVILHDVDSRNLTAHDFLF